MIMQRIFCLYLQELNVFPLQELNVEEKKSLSINFESQRRARKTPRQL